MIVGNGCTNWDFDNYGATAQMVYWHGFLSDTLKKKMDDNDCYNEYTMSALESGEISIICGEAFVEYENQMTYTNPYNLYGPCAGAEPDTLQIEQGINEVSDIKP